MLKFKNFQISKLIGLLILFCSLLLSNSIVYAQTSSGAACQPANLSQAISRNYSVSQFGVTNNGTLPFFVACPISVDIDNNHVGAFVSFDFTNSAGNNIGSVTTCLLRAIDVFDGSFAAIAIPVDNTGTFEVSAGTIDDTVFVPGATANSTIVCPLQPGETLTSYGLLLTVGDSPT